MACSESTSDSGGSAGASPGSGAATEDCTDQVPDGASADITKYLQLIGTCTKVTLGDAKIAYYQFGSGKPLVMIMGYLGTMPDWTPDLLEALSGHFQVTIFDNPGIGKSDWSGGDLSIDKMAGITAQLIEHLQLDKPNVLGWSMGADTSLTMAINHGDKIDKVIPVSGNPGGSENVAAAPGIDDQLQDPEKFIELLFPTNQQETALAYGAWEEEVSQQIPSEAVSDSAYDLYTKVETAWFSGPGIWDSLPNIKNSVLLITGADDVITPAENSENMHGQIPNSQLDSVPDAGHGVLFQGDGQVPAIVGFAG